MLTLPDVLNTAKTTVKQVQPLARQVKRVYYQLSPELRQAMGVEDNRTDIELALKPYIRRDSSYCFVKIGANDGVMGDPFGHWIRQYNWSGIMVEPVDYIFQRLVKNYQGCTNLHFEKVAIADQAGEKTFYSLRQPEPGETVPDWYQGISSFRRDVIMQHQAGFPHLEDYLCEQRVRCITFSQLLQKHQVQQIDLLHIDTEGYDYEILKTLDFAIAKPSLILYEIKHLNPEDRQASISVLTQQGYDVKVFGDDALAVLSNPSSSRAAEP